MKFKNIILCFLVCFLLFLNMNVVQAADNDSGGSIFGAIGDFFTGIGDAIISIFTGDEPGDFDSNVMMGTGYDGMSDFEEALSDSQKAILDEPENAGRLDILEFACVFKADGTEKDICFEQVQLAQILMLDDSSFCNGLDNLSDECYFEFASRDKNTTICNSIGRSDEKNKCIGIVTINNAILGNTNINLCDTLVNPYRESCIDGVLSLQDSTNFCTNNSFIASNNLVDRCKSIILSRQAMINNDSTYCEGIPLEVYQNVCFTELGLFCGDDTCTNVFEDWKDCSEDCVVCGDTKCQGNESLSTCPEDCVDCNDGICTEDYEDLENCPRDCSVCGDGIHSPPNEICDDGEDNGEYGKCKTDCSGLGERCGDKIINGPEICEQGLNPYPEECTIGNGYAGEITCNETCDEISNCIATESCGDEILNGNESCDDGNDNDGDGCSSECILDDGWTCVGTVCTETCGNDILNPGEECDDGNNNNNDSCLNTCMNASCGDGYIEWGTEECDPNDPVYGSHCNTSCQCDDGSEYCALAILFNSNNGENWTNNDNWLSDKPLNEWGGEWGGVRTDSNGNVSELYISNSSTVSGKISDISSLSGLTNLVSINLGWNRISDISPLNSLTNLVGISLHHNNISDISPLNSLINPTNLTYIDFTNNQISDISSLSGLTNLASLRIFRNQISDISSLSGLTNLNSLDLAYNQISDISSLSGLINLNRLSLAFNDIGVLSSDVCDNLVYLDTLYLQENQLGAQSCSAIQCLVNRNIPIFEYNPQQDNGFNYFDDCIGVEVCGDENIWGNEECEPPGFRPSDDILEQQKISVYSSASSMSSIVVDGDYMVIGVSYIDNGDGINSGAVYVFKREGNIWSEQQKLIASDREHADYFGHSVDIDGEYIVVGAYGDDDNGINSGAAYVFKREGNIWSEQQKLIVSDLGSKDYFGYSVVIEEEYIIIGANGDNDKGINSGAAYVFKRDLDTWSEQQKLTASDGEYFDHFGHAVTIDGQEIIISSDDNDANTGVIYTFCSKVCNNDCIWGCQ
jgi:cysteine-rich repeat protein